ncbi:hypothetical protein INT48_008231 [Thamnidium elegans]|uniref:Uncharacterized protein n=1 Tax=Thamnidium elegans TaxID=101142 RepID=A0A8H7W0Y9_9FUNG|nr:hypothetical protein INT48_008231 [Thamnidium elegans]
MLPSISNLLISSPYTSDAPIVNLSPASPSLNEYTKSPLPPLEGDDPPQRLRLPSSSPKLPFNNNTTWSTSPILSQQSPSPSCSSTSSISFEDVSSVSNESSPSLPTLEHFSTTTTTTVAATPRSRNSSTSSTKPIVSPSPIPNTQIVFDSSGQPVLKRRRGRPPTCNNNFEGGGWTFLTPTVWDIHVSEEQKERELKADHDLLVRSKLQQQVHVLDDTMSDSMNAFTNSNMDTLLQMPRKKRGRKPKTHIAGNSCFVWKDLTSTRSSAKK